MNNEIQDKFFFKQDHFIKLISPLKQYFNMSFGHMEIFLDNSYYLLIESKDCYQDFVNNVDQFIILGKDITGLTDEDYGFILWPEEPLGKAMEIFFEHNYWNGITILKREKDSTLLWWFNGENILVQDFFVKNKTLLLSFVRYFNAYKQTLLIDGIFDQYDLYKFYNGFSINIANQISISDRQRTKDFLDTINYQPIVLDSRGHKIRLTSQEIKILSLTAAGYTAKSVAKNCQISVRTVQHHIENIKYKTSLHYKEDLIDFYKKNFKKEA
jgi:DNA-binding CsgD family transcriptional regulator